MIKSNRFINIFVVTLNLLACIVGGFFTYSLDLSLKSAIHYSFVKDIVDSDFGWAVGESQINDTDFMQYRSILNELEYSHQIVSRPTFMSFIGIRDENIVLKKSEISYGQATVINLSQVCVPNDSFGYLFGLPVAPVFTYDFCDWNRYSSLGEPSYISIDFANQLLADSNEFNSLDDLIGSTFEIIDDELSITHVVANILKYDNNEGEFLKQIYGNIVVSASKVLFNQNELFLNTSFSSDVLSCRDCSTILSRRSLASTSFSIFIKGQIKKTEASVEYEKICLNILRNNTTQKILLGLLFFAIETLYIFFAFFKSTKPKIKLFHALPSILFLILTSSVSSTSHSIVLLSYFNPLISFICLSNILVIVVSFCVFRKERS